MEFRLLEVERPLRHVGDVVAVAGVERLVVADHAVAAHDRGERVHAGAFVKTEAAIRTGCSEAGPL